MLHVRKHLVLAMWTLLNLTDRQGCQYWDSVTKPIIKPIDKRQITANGKFGK